MNNKKTVIETHNLKKYRKRLRAIDKQDTNESRRLWYHVTQAINKSDYNLATLNKSLIEKQYRSLTEDFVSKLFIKNSISSDRTEWVYKGF